MPDKQDYLGLCNEAGVPAASFMASHCSRCFQAECSRSLHGKSKFEERTRTWEDRLFNNPLRMDPSDGRYPVIASQKFLPVLQGPAPARSAWVDPRELETTKTISIPEPPAVVPVQVPETPVVPVVEPPSASAPVLRNTPVRSKQMIGEGAANPPAPVLDPWQPKQPLKPGETLVKPGARIKLGS